MAAWVDPGAAGSTRCIQAGVGAFGSRGVTASARGIDSSDAGGGVCARIGTGRFKNKRKRETRRITLRKLLFGFARGEGYVPDIGCAANIEDFYNGGIIRAHISAQDDSLVRIEFRNTSQSRSQLFFAQRAAV